MPQPTEPTRPFWKPALLTVPFVVASGRLAGQLSGSVENNSWFAALAKPALYPPGVVFGVVWTILYILLGVALAMLLAAPRTAQRRGAVALFLAQLTLNFTWSTVFFALHLTAPAFVLVLAILALAVLAAVASKGVDWRVPWLMLPYFIWLGFAAGLSYRIWQLNVGRLLPY
jgi:tryptophan-rich sensory protein